MISKDMKSIALICFITLVLSSHSIAAESGAELVSDPQNQAVVFAPRPEALRKQIDQALKSKGPDYQPRTEHLFADGRPKYTNRLILEDSPYLLQHAHNPMDWYPWGPEAFAAAKRENKPIFLSIGYSTCHWCHVMERESFENSAIANILNKYFIAIKVDRERRPDIDKIYMQAVMLIARSGGWPMSSFLTTDGKPFYGGTYFPPEVFRELALSVAGLWSQQREQLIAKGDQIAEFIAQMTNRQIEAGKLSQDAVANAIVEALYSHDDFQGGFGQAPKFPHEPLLFLLLEESERSDNRDALAAIETTLDAMSQGGIYDQVGGGFHRYSTDNEWLVPHFEKMLYNQAHLGRVFLLAWRLTGNPAYRRVATQTLDYVLRDMTSADGAFYSATDADSEGEEGTFFLWTPEQIRNALSKQDAALAIEIFGITDNGNFEQSNILHLPISLAEFASQKGFALSELSAQIDRIRDKLYRSRETREHPLRDEKILTAWNGMMISTLAQAGALLGEQHYTDAAIQAAQFIWERNRQSTGELWRVHLAGSSSIAAQQEDYAYFAEGLLHLYDVTGTAHWLERAEEITNGMLRHFWDERAGGFYMSREEGRFTGMGRPSDGGSDNAIPSGNSVALRVLQMLDARVANFEYRKRATATLTAFANAINQNPSSFGYMLSGASDLQHGELGASRYIARGGVRATARQAGPDQVIVDLAIPPGWHVNSNKPLQQGLIPTSISMNKSESGWQLGEVSYPEPITATLGFQSEPLSLYQGKVQIRVAVKPDEVPERILPLQLGIQACNDRLCLPPENVTLRLPMVQANGRLAAQ